MPIVSTPESGPVFDPDKTYPSEGLDVTIETDGDGPEHTIDPKTGAMVIPQDDGGVIIDFNPRAADAKDSEFGDNLAEYIDPYVLSSLASDLIDGIEADIQSRQDWIETYNTGIDLLGLKIEAPSGGSSDSSAPVEGMSTVRHPLLLEAVVRFQSTACPELLPAAGPVKGSNQGDGTQPRDDLAELLQRDMNHFLTVTDSDYYPDTDQMLFYLGYGGTTYKKVYYDPVKKRPTSRFVSATDLIVDQNAVSLESALRVTHRIPMRTSQVLRGQLNGVYRMVDLGQASGTSDSTTEKLAEISGIAANPQRPQDNVHIIYETCCELDLEGFAHEQDGKETGLPLPYRVTLDRDSREILDIRRRWLEGDDQYLPQDIYVKYSYIPGFGFLDIGLVHLLGNTTMALTAAERMLLDAGMFANFPGFLYSKVIGRQDSNEFRVPPGGGMAIDTNGEPLTQNVMPLPYKEPSSVLMQFAQAIASDAQRLGGTAEIVSGEGALGNVPVGTVMAMIEQATIPQKAVHTRLWRSQSKEFLLLKNLFVQYPEALNERPGASAHQWTSEELSDMSIVPVADPNVPSKIHRLMQASAIVQMAQNAPGVFNPVAVAKRALKTMGIDDFEELLAAPQAQAAPPAPPPDPIKLGELQLKSKMADQAMQKDQQDNQVKIQQAQLENANRAEDRSARAQEVAAKLETDHMKLAVQKQDLDRKHGLAQIQTGNDQGLAVAQHALDSQQAAHDASIQQQTLDHTIDQANKPDPTTSGD